LDWGVPAARKTDDGDEGKDFPSLHRPFDNPHGAVRGDGTYGGQGKAVGCAPPTALLFVEAHFTQKKGRPLERPLVLGNTAHD